MALTVDDFAQDFYRQLVHEGGLDDCSIEGSARRVRGSNGRGLLCCDWKKFQRPLPRDLRPSRHVGQLLIKLDALK